MAHFGIEIFKLQLSSFWKIISVEKSRYPNEKACSSSVDYCNLFSSHVFFDNNDQNLAWPIQMANGLNFDSAPYNHNGNVYCPSRTRVSSNVTLRGFRLALLGNCSCILGSLIFLDNLHIENKSFHQNRFLSWFYGVFFALKKPLQISLELEETRFQAPFAALWENDCLKVYHEQKLIKVKKERWIK